PLLLSSATKIDSSELVVDVANQDLTRDGAVWLTANHVHVCRSTLLSEDCCHQRFVVHNWSDAAVDFALAINHDADFRDIFEVRGTPRSRRGVLLEPDVGAGHVVLRYRGLDGVVRSACLEFDPRPKSTSATSATFACHLPP